MLFVFWALLTTTALAAAGYSHYRYRERHNQYYQRVFARDGDKSAQCETGRAVNWPARSYGVPVVTLIMVCLLVPMSLFI